MIAEKTATEQNGNRAARSQRPDPSQRLQHLEDENKRLHGLLIESQRQLSGFLSGNPDRQVAGCTARDYVGVFRKAANCSVRYACEQLDVSRTSVRYITRPRKDAKLIEQLRERLRSLAEANPRWGYRRMHKQLILEGFSVNQKRVLRLYREENMALKSGPDIMRGVWERYERWLMGETLF